jgi:hypothetical protein
VVTVRNESKIGKTPLRTEAPASTDEITIIPEELSMDILAEELRLQANRMVQLEKLFELQSSINGQLLENMNNLLIRVAELDSKPKQSAIIMPDRLNS